MSEDVEPYVSKRDPFFCPKQINLPRREFFNRVLGKAALRGFAQIVTFALNLSQFESLPEKVTIERLFGQSQRGPIGLPAGENHNERKQANEEYCVQGKR